MRTMDGDDGGCARAREGEKTEEGRGTGESERGPGAACHRLVHRGGARQAGREEVEASGALASTHLCLLAEVEDDRFALMGWASATVLGQLGCQVSAR